MLKDFTTDASLSFLLLLKEAGALPDYIAGACEPDEVEHLPTLAFADTSRRLFPTHTKSATFLSAVSAFVYNHPGEGWQERLKVACHSWGITTDVRAAHAVLQRPETVKEASSDAPLKYAMHLRVGPEDPETGYYPLNNPDQIEDSALKMARDMAAERLPQSWFTEAAEVLVKEAAIQGVPSHLIPSQIRELGESRLPSPEYLFEQIEKRAAQAGFTDAHRDLYKQGVEAVLAGEIPAIEGAHFWELADRRFEIKYAGTLRPPLDAFRFGRTAEALRKEASAVVRVGGVMVPYPKLQGLPERLVAAVLEKSAAAAVIFAMRDGDGVEASAKIASLGEADQLTLLGLLVESADGPARAA